MSAYVAKDGTTFEAGCELMDATSIHRPDTHWLFMDANNHVHRWYVDDVPAGEYSARLHYTVPSLRWVKDGVGYWEDGEEYEIGHYECTECGEHIEPRYTADTVTQYIPGLRWYKVNGKSVTFDEFHAEADRLGLL